MLLENNDFEQFSKTLREYIDSRAKESGGLGNLSHAMDAFGRTFGLDNDNRDEYLQRLTVEQFLQLKILLNEYQKRKAELSSVPSGLANRLSYDLLRFSGDLAHENIAGVESEKSVDEAAKLYFELYRGGKSEEVALLNSTIESFGAESAKPKEGILGKLRSQESPIKVIVQSLRKSLDKVAKLQSDKVEVPEAKEEEALSAVPRI